MKKVFYMANALFFITDMKTKDVIIVNGTDKYYSTGL